MTQPANATFCRFCDTFTVGNARNDGTALLDSISRDLARDQDLRVQMGTGIPSIWPGLHRMWDTLAEQVALDENNVQTRSVVIGFARFTRNLVAAVPNNQRNAFASEPSLRRILHVYSSWSAIQDPESYPVTRILIETLSNMVTSNDQLMTRLWETYVVLPEDQVVLIRVLGSSDTRTTLSLFVFLANCMRESNHRRVLLSETRIGTRICIALLDRMVTLYDAEESSDGGQAFDCGYHLFAHLFDGGFAPKLYVNLKVMDEVIAPHQTTLLKLLDSYLHSSHSLTALMDMCPMLTACFFDLCAYSTQGIQKAIGVESTDKSLELNSHLLSCGVDLLLPKACEALVLVTQCLVSAMLEFEETLYSKKPQDGQDRLSSLIREAVSPHGHGIAVGAIELLRLLDIFLPRINFGKPVPSSFKEGLVGDVSEVTDSTGFTYVKRDLVRLLGVLCHKDKTIQDSIRKCDGITLIMNMCVVDERNPFLREHAIFTLHNLLEGNEENQKVVNNIRPSERWDQNGMLRK